MKIRFGHTFICQFRTRKFLFGLIWHLHEEENSLFGQICLKKSIFDQFGSRNLFQTNFLDSLVNLGIVGQVISECTRSQTSDQSTNYSGRVSDKYSKENITHWALKRQT